VSSANTGKAVARGRSRATGHSTARFEKSTADTGTTIRRSVLPSGLRVVSEHMPGVRSVALGAWVGVGSVDEPASLAGATHYLEHVLFKGTTTRSALDISAEIDSVGGELNAFTGKEFTCYYSRVLDDDLPLAVDVLGDILCNALLTSADIEAERDVIGEELAMATDDPADLVHELFAELMFDVHPLARPILGSAESVQSLSRRQIRGWFGRRYQLPSMVVSAAGNVEHDKLVRLVRKAFAPRLVDAPKAPPAPPRRQSTGRNRWEPGIDGARIRLVNRHTEQAHVVLGMSSLTRDDPDRMALSVVNTALGGGMSSRLFNDIREKRGLAYSVFSCTSAFADAGTFAVYAGCLPAKTREVLDRMSAAVREIAADGITGDELIRAKGALRGSLVLGLEDPSSRMTRLGKSELVYPEFRSTDDLLAMIDAVTLDHANAVAARVLSDEQRIAVVGPFRSARKLIGP